VIDADGRLIAIRILSGLSNSDVSRLAQVRAARQRWRWAGTAGGSGRRVRGEPFLAARHREPTGCSSSSNLPVAEAMLRSMPRSNARARCFAERCCSHSCGFGLAAPV